ncbi:MAG: hypothetical protein ACRD1X_08975 [Vicinamibacteria bacterium]
MERETIRKIREAARTQRLGREFTAVEVNAILKIHWAGTFLPKHRVGNPGGCTEFFFRMRPGVYRLKTG